MKRATFLSRAILSLWIVYNIFVMLVMPNVSAYFGRTTARYITPYANTVGLNASWNFFSPDPAHTMYIHYVVHFADEFGQDIKEAIDGYFPEEKDKSIFSTSRKRNLYAMRFMVIDPKRLRVLFGPWLCTQFPGATSIEMEHVVETVPPLDESVLFKSSDVRDLSKEVQFVREEHSCTGGADEEAL